MLKAGTIHRVPGLVGLQNKRTRNKGLKATADAHLCLKGACQKLV